MDNIQNNQKFAGYFFLVSCLLHVLAIFLSGGALVGVFLAPVFLLALIGYGLLSRNWRWLAYIGFIGALIGIIASVYQTGQTFGLVCLTIYGITLADFGAALMLFIVLWKNPKRV